MNTSFLIVLVDIQRAAEHGEIHCIEMPLTEEEDEFQFVALSYRWGELAETIINTNLGYLASVTSFDLDDFFTLCKMMAREPDLQNINYVWVDAICVNQSDQERRKATIYQMTNIYKKASYIVAVPDLHLRYLVGINTAIKKMTDFTLNNSQYIYHVLHDHIQQLVELDEQWLDGIGVPKHQALRKMLAKYTHKVGTALMKYNVHDDDYETKHALDHMRNAIQDTQTTHRNVDFVCIDDTVEASSNNQETPLTHYQLSSLKIINLPSSNTFESMNDDDDSDWPYKIMKEINNDQWKQQIAQRSEEIRQSITFLEDLIKDWSSRVWVINEYNIAKRKKSKKMKYWFIQLQRGQVYPSEDKNHRGLTFFEFNFDDLAFGRTAATAAAEAPRHHHHHHHHHQPSIFKARSSSHALTTPSVFYGQQFQKTMLRQLNQQTFLEKILKSKASKNEDRFYAILPLSKYADKLGSKDVVASWNIHTMVSVRLKLFEWMETTDKLDLLYLSGNINAFDDDNDATNASRTRNNSAGSMILPTFATTRIQWPTQADEQHTTSSPLASSFGHHHAAADNDDHGMHPCNFDLTKKSTIELLPMDKNNTPSSMGYKLHVKPCFYYTCDQRVFAETILRAEKNTALCKAVGLDPTKDQCDLVCIPSYDDADITSAYRHLPDYHPRQLFLVGCQASNTWMILTGFDFSSVTQDVPHWEIHSANEDTDGFDIY